MVTTLMIVESLQYQLSKQMKQQQKDSANSVCLVIIGMSGTGKTTFVSKMHQQSSRIYSINLDPAVKVVPYKPFVDIRETHQYKKVMKQYKLGPNGAILTALNLYLSQPELIIKKIEDKMNENKEEKKIFIVDIPGQIQVFTWSASSLILVQAISTIMPVKILYIIDSFRCQNPNVFLSNLLFSESIKYRFQKYSFSLILNKCDAADGDKLISWIQDYEKFMQALQEDNTYLSTLNKSVVLHLSDFYENTPVAKVSSKTGYGFNEVEKLIDFSFK